MRENVNANLDTLANNAKSVPRDTSKRMDYVKNVIVSLVDPLIILAMRRENASVRIDCLEVLSAINAFQRTSTIRIARPVGVISKVLKRAI